MKRIVFLFANIFAISLASAASVEDCNEAGFGISSLISGSEKTYYDGQVATYEVDREEPASSPSGIAINLPIKESQDGPAYMSCKVVYGLSSVNWAAKTSTYDEDRGVLLVVPAREYNPENDTSKALTLKIRINLEKGTVALE